MACIAGISTAIVSVQCIIFIEIFFEKSFRNRIVSPYLCNPKNDGGSPKVDKREDKSSLQSTVSV